MFDWYICNHQWAKMLSKKLPVYNVLRPIYFWNEYIPGGKEISKPAEACIRFMAELKGAEFEAHERANNFIHYRLKFNGLKGPRKLKSLLGSAFDGTKEKKYNEDTMIKDFKAYCFSLRSGAVPKAPSGWSIKNEPDLDFYADIIGKDFSLDDLL